MKRNIDCRQPSSADGSRKEGSDHRLPPGVTGPRGGGFLDRIGTATGTPPLALGESLSNTITINTGAAGTFTLWVTGLVLPARSGASSISARSPLTSGILPVALVTSVKEKT